MGADVPTEVMAEDVDAFAAWDADNPPPRDDANIQLNLGMHLGLLAKLKSLEGEGDSSMSLEWQYERGQAVLGVILELARVAERLTELGHAGAEANAAVYLHAAGLCREGLLDMERQMKGDKLAGLSGLVAPAQQPAKIAPRPNPWETQKGPRPWLNKRK